MSGLNFSIGQDFGLMLVNLAREKLLASYNIAEASTLIVESLAGIKVSDAVDLILGKTALTVHVEEQEIELADISKHPEFKFDIAKHIRAKYNGTKEDQLDSIRELGHVEGSILDRVDNDGKLSVTIKFPVKDLFQTDRSFNFDGAINSKYEAYISTVKFANTLQNEIMQLDNFVRFLKTQGVELPEDFSDLASELEMYIDRIINFSAHRSKVIRNMDYAGIKLYLKANEELENTLKLATPFYIDPKKPTSKSRAYNAMWIGRDGACYAANGTIANFLHLKIADALVEHDVIPKGAIANTSAWLEKNGWIKMQDNWVQYTGYYALYGETTPLTDAQIKTVSDIGLLYYDNVLRVGDSKTVMSATKFRQIDELLLRNVFKL